MALDFGLFCAVMGGGPFITIDLHILRTCARVLAHLTFSFQKPELQLSQPGQSVECISVAIENSTKKTPDMPGL
jgi:hypothetical protein